MNITIKLSPAERIRRAKAADPSLTVAQLRQRLGVTRMQVHSALGRKPAEPKLRART